MPALQTHFPRPRPRPRCRQHGFSYVAVLLAVALLALCAAPAADAIRSAGAAPAVSARQLAALLCLKGQMETVLAEPYQSLLNAAAGPGAAAAPYSLAEDAACPERTVYIARVSVDSNGNASYPGNDSGLLQVVVTVAASGSGAAGGASATPGAAAAMSLATMVVR